MKDEIIKMLEAGESYKTICNVLNVAKSTVAYHARRNSLSKTNGVKTQNYDWNHVQLTYDTGLCLTELAMVTGISTTAITAAVKSGRLKIDRRRKCSTHKEIPTQSILQSNSTIDVGVVKRRIRRDGLLPYQCNTDKCPLSIGLIWNDLPIVLHLDHINGIRNDHRLENLRWLCPNCHSQTNTYCGRNKMVTPERIELS